MRLETQKGLTLLEMTLAMLIGGSVVLGLGFVGGMGFDAYRSGQLFSAMQRDGSSLMEYFAAAARRCDSVVVQPQSITFRFPPLLDGTREPPLTIASREGQKWAITLGEKSWTFSDTGIELAELPRVFSRTDIESGSRIIELAFLLGADQDSLTFSTQVYQRNHGIQSWVVGEDGEDL